MPSSETGQPIPYNPLDLPCATDRADALGGRLGTPSAADQIVVSSYGGSGIARLPIEEEADSPVMENAEQQTITHRFHGSWNELLTRWATKRRGIIRTDSSGYVVKLLSCTLQRATGGRATISTAEEIMNGDTPPDLFEVIPIELGLHILKHPRYVGAFLGTGPTGGYGSVTEQANQMVIRLLQDYMENTSAPWRNAITKLLYDSIGAPNGAGSIGQGPAPYPQAGTTAGTLIYPTGSKISGTDMAKAAALEIIQKYWRGEETPSVVGFQITWTEFRWTPYPMVPGGFIEDPILQGGLPDFLWSTHWPPDPSRPQDNIFYAMAAINPQMYSRNGTRAGDTEISWRREADQESRERTFFGIQHRWIGSPIGHWDVQLYNRNARPSVYQNYVPPTTEAGTPKWVYVPTT